MKKCCYFLFSIVVLATIVFVSCSSTTSQVTEEETSANITLISFSQGKNVYKIDANSSHGYNIVSYLVIPKNYKYSHLIVYPNKSGSRDDYSTHERKVKNQILTSNTSNKSVSDDLKAITLWPVLPQDDSEYMRLGTKLNVPGKWNRLDLQMKNAIEDAYAFLESIGITLAEGIVLTGYSGEGSCCVNFAMLHPEMVHAVAAGGLAWHLVQPLERIGKYTLDWPLGINGYKRVTGYDFDYESWKKIKYFLDQGLRDDRGVKYGGLLENAGFSLSNERKLWDFFASSLIECSPNIELVLYLNEGHRPVRADYVKFLKENEGDEFVPIKPSKEAEVLLGKN